MENEFLSTLPQNCPPSDCYRRTIELYRLFEPAGVTESFKSYVDLDPVNVDYLSLCKAYGISLFDNLNTIAALLLKENNVGKKIAKVKITEDCGTLSAKPSRRGHYTLWLFKTFDLQQ